MDVELQIWRTCILYVNENLQGLHNQNRKEPTA